MPPVLADAAAAALLACGAPSPVLADAAAAALLAEVAQSRVHAEAPTAVLALAGTRPTMRAFGHVAHDPPMTSHHKHKDQNLRSRI